MDFRAGLDERLTTLRGLRAIMKPHARHLVPDLVLLALLDGIVRSCDAVASLADAGMADLAYPNARAAFEFSQNALMLVTSENYDLAGSLAYVYFTRADFGLLEQSATRTGEPTVTEDGEEVTLTKNLDEIASHWRDFSLGQARWLAEARTTIRKPRSKPDNWSGFQFADELPLRLAKLTASTPGTSPVPDAAAIYKMTYAFITRSSHTHLKLGVRRFKGRPNEFVDVELAPQDYDETSIPPLAVAGGAAGQGIVALMLRSRIGNA